MNDVLAQISVKANDVLHILVNPLELLVLINVTPDNFYLSLQDIPEVDALFKHGQTRQHRWQSAGLENQITWTPLYFLAYI